MVALARIELRLRWRSYLAAAVLLALAGGVSLFALAGARRTLSAYPRFLVVADVSDVSVTSAGIYDQAYDDRIAALPGVEASRTYIAFTAYHLVDGKPAFAEFFEAAGTLNGRYFDQDRFTPTAGRMADPARSDEVVINQAAAEAYGYRLGQQLRLGVYGQHQTEEPSFFADPTPSEGGVEKVTIVGIGLFPDEVVQDETDRQTRMLLTPAFTERHRPQMIYSFQGLRLRDGAAGVDRIRATVGRFAGSGKVKFRVTADAANRAQHGLRPLAVALAVFGGLTGIAALVLAAQAIARALALGAVHRGSLRAIGAPPRTVAVASVIAAGAAISAGAVGASLLAFAASPLMPIGPVRAVDPADGLAFDATVLLGGAAVVVAVLLAVIAVIATRSVRQVERAPQPRPSRLAAAASRSNLPPTLVAGLRFAFDPETAASSSPTRSVIAGAAIALACLVGAVTFSASLGSLVEEPARYGWTADAVIVSGNGYGNIPLEGARRVLDGDDRVEAWGGAYFGASQIDGVDVPLLGMATDADNRPPLLDGRYPSTDREVVLGPVTADRLGVDAGDEVTVTSDRGPQRLRVVGHATFPSTGILGAVHTSLGDGALLSPQLIPGWDLDITAERHGHFGPRAIFVRFTPGTDVDAELAHLRKTTMPLADFAGITASPVQRPAEITDARSISSAPILLAAALSVGSIVSLVLALVSAVSRRRRDLSVMRTLGFTRRQLRATVRWQATATMLVGLVLGVPIGVASGRLLWSAFARELHVVDRPVVPTLALAALVLATLAVANVIALAPARSAARVASRPEPTSD